jgi:hypothetical protein
VDRNAERQRSKGNKNACERAITASSEIPLTAPRSQAARQTVKQVVNMNWAG